MGSLLVFEEYFDRFYRVLRVDSPGGERLYSVDFYAELPRLPAECGDTLELGSVKLCYSRLGLCEAVFLVYGGSRVELVNLRLKTRVENDPAGGSLAAARSICLEEAERLLEAVRSSLGRQG